MIDLTHDFSITGYWKFEFDNGKSEGDFFGILTHSPNDCCTIKFVFKNSDIPFELTPEKYKSIKINRLIGTTDYGTCFVFDAFSSGPTYRAELSEHTIYANLISISQKAMQKLGEEYTPTDITNPDIACFYEADISFTGLFQYIEAMTINKRLNSEDYSLYKACSVCGDVTLSERFQHWTQVNVSQDITIDFYVSASVDYKYSGKKIETPNITIRVASKDKSLKEFQRISWEIKTILSLFVDSQIEIISILCKKNLHGNNYHDECTYEEHNLIFISNSTIQEQRNYFESPAKFTCREQFNSMLKASYELFETIPDFFVEMQRIDRGDYTLRLISILKIFDSAYRTLADEALLPLPKNTDLKERLKESLTSEKFSDEEIRNIIHNACSPSLKEKVFSVINSARKNFFPAIPDIYSDTITKAISLRNKESHGELRKKFSTINISHADIELAYGICRTALYSQFLKKIGMDPQLITETVHSYFLRPYHKAFFKEILGNSASPQ